MKRLLLMTGLIAGFVVLAGQPIPVIPVPPQSFLRQNYKEETNMGVRIEKLATNANLDVVVTNSNSITNILFGPIQPIFWAGIMTNGWDGMVTNGWSKEDKSGQVRQLAKDGEICRIFGHNWTGSTNCVVCGKSIEVK